MSSSRGKARKAAQRPARVRLAADQYPELNETFYQSNPASYFRTRLQSLLLMMSDSSQVDEALAEGSSYGVLQFRGMVRLEPDARLRYAALESTVLVHHASETLVRLFLAHVSQPPCPWLEVARFRSVDDYKRDLRRMLDQGASGLDRNALAVLFLGGTSPEDSGITLDGVAWQEATEGLVTLLHAVATRLLGQRELYNAAKHGLVGVPVEGGTSSYTPSRGGETVEVGGGPAVTFLHLVPGGIANPLPEDGRWRATTTYVRIDADIMLTHLICAAVDSLWAVAQRHYVGVEGRIATITRDQVHVALFASQIATKHLANDIDYSLPVERRDDQGNFGLEPAKIQVNAVRLGEDVLKAYERLRNYEQQVSTIDLPLRPQDVVQRSTSGRHLLSFSPPGSSVV